MVHCAAASWLRRPVKPAAPASTASRAVPGIRVGHFTLTERPTGCTVILADNGAVGARRRARRRAGHASKPICSPRRTRSTRQRRSCSPAAVRSASMPATGVDEVSRREEASAIRDGRRRVPIVPAAILFDLNVGGGRSSPARTRRAAISAASSAKAGAIEEGSVGAGAGATVGKLMRRRPRDEGRHRLGVAHAPPTGSSSARSSRSTRRDRSIDPRTGKPVAGVRTADGKTLEDPFALVRRGVAAAEPARENTTIGVVATNARLTKAQALKVAEMAHDGMARAIVPSHTPSRRRHAVRAGHRRSGGRRQRRRASARSRPKR